MNTEYLAIGDRTYARLKQLSQRPERNPVSRKLAIFGAAFLTVSITLAVLVKGAGEAGDYERVKVLGWTLVGFMLVTLSVVLVVGAWRARPVPLPDFLRPIPSPEHRLIALASLVDGSGVVSTGWATLKGGRFSFKSAAFECEFGCLDWEHVRYAEGYAVIRMKKFPRGPNQTLRLCAMQVTNEHVALSNDETKRLVEDLKRLPISSGKSVLPPIELFQSAFHRAKIVRYSSVGLAVGLLISSLGWFLGPRQTPEAPAMIITMSLMSSIVGLALACVRPMRYRAREKAIEKWRRG